MLVWCVQICGLTSKLRMRIHYMRMRLRYHWFSVATMGNASDKAGGRDRSQTMSGEEAPIIGIPHRTDPSSLTERGELGPFAKVCLLFITFQIIWGDCVINRFHHCPQRWSNLTIEFVMTSILLLFCHHCPAWVCIELYIFFLYLILTSLIEFSLAPL